MDGQAYERLEKALIAAKVPRSLWPRFEESLRYQLLRRRISDDDELRRQYSQRLGKDEIEKKRRSAFSLFVVIFLWLLAEQERERRQAADFARRSFAALTQTEHSKFAGGDTTAQAVACLQIASGFSYYEAESAFLEAVPGGCPAGSRLLEEAQRELHEAAQQQTESEPEPTPTDPTDWCPDLDDCAGPNW